MKHAVKLTTRLYSYLDVAYEAEFDTETGEARIVGTGSVASHPEHFTGRQIERAMEIGAVDFEAYRVLLENGTIPFPKDGDFIMIAGSRVQFENSRLPIDDDEEPVADDIVEALGQAVDDEQNGRSYDRSRRRRKKKSSAVG